MEKWKQVEDTRFEISNRGNFRNGETKTLLRPYIHWQGGGYLRYRWKEGNKSWRIHRLVAQAFIRNPKKKPEVNHIDGDKINNDVSNLEWVTSKENKEHAKRYGLYFEKRKRA